MQYSIYTSNSHPKRLTGGRVPKRLDGDFVAQMKWFIDRLEARNHSAIVRIEFDATFTHADAFRAWVEI